MLPLYILWTQLIPKKMSFLNHFTFVNDLFVKI